VLAAPRALAIGASAGKLVRTALVSMPAIRWKASLTAGIGAVDGLDVVSPDPVRVDQRS
jgi:hypothetical protein